MRLLDLDLRRAEAVAIEHGGGKAQARQADATSDLAEQLAGMDVLVNSAAYRINLAAMGACLDAGCHYMDLGGLYHVTAEQLELSGEVRAARAAGAARDRLGSGQDQPARRPGRSRACPAARPRSRFSPRGGTSIPPDGMSFPYAVRTLLDEITMPPMALIDGRSRELEPLQPGPTRRLRRADRRGRRRSSPSTRRSSPSATASAAERDLRALAVTRGAREPGGAAGGERGADCRSCSLRIAPLSQHRLRPHRRGHRRRHRGARPRASPRRNEAWGLGGGIVSTATPAAAAVRLLARGAITRRGALPPESCIDPERDVRRAREPRRALRLHQRAPRSARRSRTRWRDEGRRPHRDQGGRVPGRPDAGRRARAARSTATRC